MNTDLQRHSGADTKSVMACFHPKSTNFRNASVGLTTQYGQYGTVPRKFSAICLHASTNHEL